MDIVDIINDMEEEAEKAKKEFKGVDLTKLGEEAYFLEAKIAEAEAMQKAFAKQLEKIIRHSISQALAVAGVNEFGFDGPEGRCRIALETKVVGTLANADDTEAAVAFLEESGLKGVIRKTISLDFPMEDAEEADTTAERIRAMTNRDLLVSQNIHPSTLAAFVRSKLREDPTWDYAKVGFTAFPQAKFTKKT